MAGQGRWPHRALAVAHLLWAVALFAAAGYWAYAALSVVGHMVTGNLVTNVVTAVLLAAMWSGPLAVLGLWLGRLGHRLWSGAPGLRPVLVRTHLILLVPGLLLSAVGIYATRQAARSAADGGGIGEPLAWIPLLLGVPLVALSVASLLGRAGETE